MMESHLKTKFAPVAVLGGGDAAESFLVEFIIEEKER